MSAPKTQTEDDTEPSESALNFSAIFKYWYDKMLDYYYSLSWNEFIEYVMIFGAIFAPGAGNKAMIVFVLTLWKIWYAAEFEKRFDVSLLMAAIATAFVFASNSIAPAIGKFFVKPEDLYAYNQSRIPQIQKLATFSAYMMITRVPFLLDLVRDLAKIVQEPIQDAIEGK